MLATESEGSPTTVMTQTLNMSQWLVLIYLFLSQTSGVVNCLKVHDRAV